MTIEDFLKEIPSIDPNQKYWLVRTSAGDYYDTFAINKRIGFGESYIKPDDVLKFSTNYDEFYKSIAPIIKEHTESDRPGTTAGQFFRFYHEMKKGDLVLIPSVSSEKLWIGKIVDDKPKYFEYFDENKNISCPHIHTREVEWITEKYRTEFNPKITSLFFSHHALVDAGDYSQFINGAIHDLFVANNKAHLILRIETTQHIRARMLISLFSQLFDITQQFEDTEKNNVNVDDVDIRININSPGAVELISASIVTLLVIGLVIVFISGGKMKSKYIELTTDGFIKKLSDFLTQRDASKLKAEILRHSLKDLEVRDPKELIKIIQNTIQ